MRTNIRFRLAALLLGAAVLAGAYRVGRTETAMAETAARFIESLTDEQKKTTVFDFQHKDRTVWHYFPERGFKQEYGYERPGIMFKHMDPKQRLYAQALLASGLSQAGYIKAMNVISMEDVVRIMEADTTGHRDAERYHMTVFGKPSDSGTWAWRVEGHHFVLTFTFQNGKLISSSPTFYGANPHEVPYGPHRGMRALAKEEDLARALMNSLTETQRKQALFSAEAPYDILTMATVRAKLDGKPQGIAASSLNEKQHGILMQLVAEYANNLTPEAAEARMKTARATPRAQMFFGWAGRVDRDPPPAVEIGKVTTGNRHPQGNYYRIQTPLFLIEYDNTQNQSNHSHSVWRDFRNDFGLDVLALHRRMFPHDAD
ncbi:MAG: DUF3500 domain-containing protein [Bryobacteraceae bacterium]